MSETVRPWEPISGPQSEAFYHADGHASLVDVMKQVMQSRAQSAPATSVFAMTVDTVPQLGYKLGCTIRTAEIYSLTLFGISIRVDPTVHPGEIHCRDANGVTHKIINLS